MNTCGKFSRITDCDILPFQSIANMISHLISSLRMHLFMIITPQMILFVEDTIQKTGERVCASINVGMHLVFFFISYISTNLKVKNFAFRIITFNIVDE